MKTITLPFKNFREKLIETFFNVSIKPSQWLKRNKESWHLSRQKMLEMPSNTLGHDVGYFLQRHNFELVDKSESHDVYHVLLGYETTVADEIKLQYFLLGNGRLSFIGYAIMAVGFHLLPEYFREYIKAFRQGRQCKNIIHWDMKNLLSKNTEILRGRINRQRKAYYELNYLKLKLLRIMEKSSIYQKWHSRRESILSKMVGFLNPIYKAVMPRNRAWNISLPQMRLMQQGSLGKDVANFMDKNQFELLPYLETHDVYHVLLGYEPHIVDESRLYFFLLGNGKYSLEVINTVLVSLVLLPDYWLDLFRHYRRGRDARSIAKWDFRYLMHEETEILRGIVFAKKESKFFI
jgi:ubiquinone biosynthesis protein Coq4